MNATVYAAHIIETQRAAERHRANEIVRAQRDRDTHHEHLATGLAAAANLLRRDARSTRAARDARPAAADHPAGRIATSH